MKEPWVVAFEDVTKEFVLHTQGGVRIPVLHQFSMTLAAKECLALKGPSGAGKSTILRLLYGNYKACGGKILIRHKDTMVDVVRCEPHEILAIRDETLGYVSQFLRVIPRVPAMEVVMEPMLRRKMTREAATERAAALLTRLRIPERLWKLSPTTFSGGEQQRINIARGFAVTWPVMILDEPTASLDPVNRETVRTMIREVTAAGSAVIGIFHDTADREAVVTRTLGLTVPGEVEHAA